METPREILVTSALPYANGEIHLGHLLEYIQTDIWVRFQKLRGHTCHYICADDAHGTPIMLRAQQEGIDPEELIAKMHASHLADFSDFHIEFDNYYTTHSEENREASGEIFAKLKDAGYITERDIEQAYDAQAGMFLPDRFIRGNCPRCGAEDQYGDCCEVCGATYSSDEVVNPKSVISGTTPTTKQSTHLFFALGQFEKDLKAWTSTDTSVQTEISNKLQEWFDVGLQDWDISRDAPYFGFEIPGYQDKYFYVWLDAPIGYIASFKNLCKREAIDFDHYWQADSSTELHHFIGKDIAYFHTLFWPAMLKGAGLRLPTAVHCHGFVTINGQKMSKSRNTFITAKTYLQHLEADYLRYYFATRIAGHIGDVDLNLEEFGLRIDSDLVGKFINIASRCASFIKKHFDQTILCDEEVTSHDLYRQSLAEAQAIAEHYEELNFAGAMRRIMELADQANRYIEQEKPWEMAKQDASDPRLHKVCSLGILLFAQLALYLKPVIPASIARCEDFLNYEFTSWGEAPFANQTTHTLNPFKPLITRVEREQIDKLTQAQ